MKLNKGVFVLVVILFSIPILLGGCNMGTKESALSPKYPEKPITVIVPYAAGGSSDLLARALEKTAQKHLGNSLIVTNMPGGAATIAMNELAGAKPDGYTIGIVGSGVILQPLYGQTRYHYPTALEPLVNVTSSSVVVAVLADKPWKDLKDLVSFAKEHPGEIKVGHSGLGTPVHIVEEAFAQEAGIVIKQVPFKGDTEAVAALLGGHVQLIGAYTPATLKEHVKSGTVRILGVAEKNRLTIPGFENIPTFKEQGIEVDFNFWNGIAAPKGLPAAEKARLTAGLKEMINDPDFKKSMEELGMSVQYMEPEKFAEKWAQDNSRLTKIIRETGIAELIASQKK